MNLQLKVEECIDEIADELGFEISYYPTVYFLSNNFSLKGLGLKKGVFEECSSVKKSHSNIYLLNKKIILLGSKNLAEIAEEAGHFVHHHVSKYHTRKLNKKNLLTFSAISEMLGFFSSKLIVPDRNNPFKFYPDQIFEKRRYKKFESKKNFVKEHFFIYKQGYGLGEILFNSYISEVVSKDFVRNLFLKRFDEDNSPLETFTSLKFGLLNYNTK